ncbi:MAG: hypothetical protein IT379_38290 [Deltaproteobacteria bacterium]|nr:hypothetical protein [Deltaproteobacteria bacterium]
MRRVRRVDRARGNAQKQGVSEGLEVLVQEARDSAWLYTSILSLVMAGCHCRPPEPEGPIEWERMPVRAAAGEALLKDVAGTGPDDVWAVGEARSGASTGLPAGCAFHFDGQRWTESALPAGTGSLNAVAPVSRTDVWAASATGTVLRFDGRAWTPQTMPEDMRTVQITSFSIVPGGELWATVNRRGRILRRRVGSDWTWVSVDAMPESQPLAIWATSSTNAWIPSGRAARFDGQRWQRVVVGGGTLNAVHGTGPNDVWMVGGRGGNLSVFSWQAIGYHHDGRAWSEVPMPPDTLFMHDVCATSPNEAVAVGAHGHALRWNGRAWRRSRTGFEARQPAPFPNLTALSCWPGHAMAVGVIGPNVLRLRSGR